MIDTFLMVHFARLPNDVSSEVMELLPNKYIRDAFGYHPNGNVVNMAFAASFGKGSCLRLADVTHKQTRIDSVTGIPVSMDFLEAHQNKPMRWLRLNIPSDFAAISEVKNLANAMNIQETHVVLLSRPKRSPPEQVHFQSLLAIRSLTEMTFDGI